MDKTKCPYLDKYRDCLLTSQPRLPCPYDSKRDCKSYEERKGLDKLIIKDSLR